MLHSLQKSASVSSQSKAVLEGVEVTGCQAIDYRYNGGNGRVNLGSGARNPQLLII